MNKTYSSSEVWFPRSMRYPLFSKVATSPGMTPGYGESSREGIISLYRWRRETLTMAKKIEVRVYQRWKLTTKRYSKTTCNETRKVGLPFLLFFFYWATPTGEAQFKIWSFISARNGIPMGRLLRCTISLASSWSLWHVQLIWLLSLASTGNDVIVFAIARVFGRFMICAVVWPRKSICIKFACLSYHSFRSFYMVDGGKSCCRSSERKVVSTPPLRADFTQRSSPRSSHGPLQKTSIFHAFLQEEVSHRFMFTHKTFWLFNCWLYGIGIRFSPNNLKRKARFGSDLLQYVQVNKIMQNMRKKKVRKHLRRLQRVLSCARE